jgi:hypothetical protein
MAQRLVRRRSADLSPSGAAAEPEHAHGRQISGPAGADRGDRQLAGEPAQMPSARDGTITSMTLLAAL